MQEEHMKKGAIESAGIESGIAFAGRSKADAKKRTSDQPGGNKKRRAKRGVMIS